jgi:putative flippase GtrA
MPVLPVPDRLKQRASAMTFSTLAKFGSVGVAATLAYFVLANAFVATVMSDAKFASFAAYICASLISYFGHRSVTFQSEQTHKVGLPRFIASTFFGGWISYALPKILQEQLGFTHFFAFAAVCLVVPVMNYLLFKFWVFAINDNEGAVLK